MQNTTNNYNTLQHHDSLDQIGNKVNARYGSNRMKVKKPTNTNLSAMQRQQLMMVNTIKQQSREPIQG
jgi:hypothetical protein